MIQEKIALVTGATSGIGRAVALALAEDGARVHAVGRDRARMTDLVNDSGGRVSPELVDLEVDAEVDELCDRVADGGRLDLLVHCAGMIGHATMREASEAELHRMLKMNVGVPYTLTRRLLDTLVASRGDVVFVNSSATRFPRAYSGQFAITQHGLVGMADSLREELNPDGVRVLSIFPGRTATPRTRRLTEGQGRSYDPDLLLQPESVAATILAAVSLPRSAEVTEIHIRPARKG